MADDGKGFWQSAPGMLTGAAALIGAVTGLIVALQPGKATTPAITIPAAPTHAGNGQATPDPAPPVVVAQDPSQPPAMGPLEPGVGYEGNDHHQLAAVFLGDVERTADVGQRRNHCVEQWQRQRGTHPPKHVPSR